MRVAQNEQMTIGEVDISNIRFDPKSRDDIPKILRGLLWRKKITGQYALLFWIIRVHWQSASAADLTYDS
jgi:hypothetical protein